MVGEYGPKTASGSSKEQKPGRGTNHIKESAEPIPAHGFSLTVPACARIVFRFVVQTPHIMAITKAKKEDIVAKLTDSLKDAVSVVFVNFKGLSVSDTSAMRKSLKQEGVGYYVAKKTLVKRVLENAGYEGDMPSMEGELALAWSADDATAAARGIYDAGKAHKDALTIRGGIFENRYLDAAGMTAIATIPPVPVLRGMFVNVINSPIQGLVIALDQFAQKQAA